jgi:plastocyanin
MKKQSLIISFLLAFLVPAFALAAQVSVSLGVNSISPSVVTINAGDTVVWNNTSNTTQSVTADNGGFQSGAMGPGGQFAATFSQSGTYNYYDNAQGGAIVGEVIVNGTAATTPVVSTQTTSYINPNYPTTTSSNSSQAASLTAEVQSLIAEIDALEGNTSGSVSSTSGVSGAPSYTAGGACPQIGRVLSYGTSGSDVLGVQEFLGVTPATGFYGTITQSAVEQWQAENNIISYGTPDTTGYGVVGPRTEAAIRLACS